MSKAIQAPAIIVKPPSNNGGDGPTQHDKLANPFDPKPQVIHLPMTPQIKEGPIKAKSLLLKD